MVTAGLVAAAEAKICFRYLLRTADDSLIIQVLILSWECTARSSFMKFSSKDDFFNENTWTSRQIVSCSVDSASTTIPILKLMYKIHRSPNDMTRKWVGLESAIVLTHSHSHLQDVVNILDFRANNMPPPLRQQLEVTSTRPPTKFNAYNHVKSNSKDSSSSIFSSNSMTAAELETSNFSQISCAASESCAKDSAVTEKSRTCSETVSSTSHAIISKQAPNNVVDAMKLSFLCCLTSKTIS
jgi:hypothetical protein